MKKAKDLDAIDLENLIARDILAFHKKNGLDIPGIGMEIEGIVRNRFQHMKQALQMIEKFGNVDPKVEKQLELLHVLICCTPYKKKG